MKNLTIVMLIVILIVIAGGFLYINMNKSGNISGQTINTIKPSEKTNTPVNNANTNVREINLDAKRFEYTPSTITIKKGEKVRIIVNNLDTTHGIKIPDLGISGIDSVEFTADKTGTFDFYCNDYCGQGHPDMQGRLVVTD